ncbi:MAG: ATP-binding protein [Chloroflexota bacterium]
MTEKVSLIITTNLPFSEWVAVLGDERLTTGLLDRLNARSHIWSLSVIRTFPATPARGG